MEVKSYDKIFNDMKNYIIAHQDKLTDFNDGGVLLSQIEAFARELNMLYISCRVGFSSFLRGLPYSVFGFEQKKGKKASVDVVFSRSKQFAYNTNIPAGTVVTAGSLKFITAAAGTVLSGATDSDPVPATAEFAGDKYNTPAQTIKTIVSLLPADIVSVNNPAAASGGKNTEDWAAYLDRFSDYIMGLQRTNESGYRTALTDLIRSMSIDEHFPPLDGIWNMTLYLEDGSGGMTPESLAEAKKIMDGEFAKGISGYRASGINIRYKKPEIVPATTNIIITTERRFYHEEDTITVVVTDEVRKYINSLKIGKPLLISDLIVMLRRLSAVKNVQIQGNDIYIRKDQILRFQDCYVTVEIDE